MAKEYRIDVMGIPDGTAILGHADGGVNPAITVLVRNDGEVVVVGSPKVTLIASNAVRVQDVKFGEIRGSLFTEGLGDSNVLCVDAEFDRREEARLACYLLGSENRSRPSRKQGRTGREATTLDRLSQSSLTAHSPRTVTVTSSRRCCAAGAIGESSGNP